MTQLTKTIVVPKSAARVYDLWLDVENYHEFWPFVESVELIDRHTTYWTVKTPDGTLLYWDEKLTQLEENSRIAWRSTGGDVHSSGLIALKSLNDDETEVSLTLHFTPEPDLAEGSAAAIFDDVGEWVSRILHNFRAYAPKDWADLE